MSDVFNSILADETQQTISVGSFLLCIGVSLLIGGLYFLAYSYRGRSKRSMRATLALLPAVVCVVVMMVNGSIGIGVAVAGAFSLVRFRSAPGSAKDICILFMTMCSGLIAGVGYLAYAVIFSALMCLLILLMECFLQRGEARDRNRILKITVPEDLDYPQVFCDILEECTASNELTRVKTSHLGSLYQLTYRIALKEGVTERQLIDRLRVRNGNLEISVLRQEENNEAL